MGKKTKSQRQLKRLEKRQKRQFQRIERRGIMMRALKAIIKVFKREVKINNLNDSMQKKAIYIANHNGASGPFTYELYFPHHLTPWGAHQMTGRYKSRWNYLYYTFYQQKLKYGKFRSFIAATLFAIISKMVYNGVGLIPTYHDARLMKSIRHSINILDAGHGILIFPENSDNGYKEVLEEYNRGFITLAKLYYKMHGEDLPVYCMYFSKQHGQIVVGQPYYVNKMLKDGMTEHEVARMMVQKTNALYYENIINNNANAATENTEVI